MLQCNCFLGSMAWCSTGAAGMDGRSNSYINKCFLLGIILGNFPVLTASLLQFNSILSTFLETHALVQHSCCIHGRTDGFLYQQMLPSFSYHTW